MALRTIWIGTAFVLSFTVLSQLAVAFAGSPLSAAANDSMSALFGFSLRVAAASIIGYVFAQNVNIALYEWLRKRTKGKHLWMRSIVANAVAQIIDSALFFSIAFFDLAGPLLVQAIFAGWVMKVAVVILGVPFLYLGTRRKS